MKKNRFDKQCEIEGGKIPRYTDDFLDKEKKISKKQNSFLYVLYAGIILVAGVVLLGIGSGISMSVGNKSNAKAKSNGGVDGKAVGAGVVFIAGVIMMVVGGIGLDKEPAKPTDDDFLRCE